MKRTQAIIYVLTSDCINERNYCIFRMDDLMKEVGYYEPKDVVSMFKNAEKLEEDDEYFGFPDGEFRTFSEDDAIEFFDQTLKETMNEDEYQSLCDMVRELENE